MEVKPLTSLNALISWSGPGNLSYVLKNLPDLEAKSPPLSLTGDSVITNNYRTLVCHDMQNGYNDDRFCFGTSNDDAYRFYHWASLDIFVYFSHHFVTIPPTGWVHTAHRHGVKVLGTLITEWEDGESIWDQILNDEAVMEVCLNNLVEIANTYRFEGWLLNVENKISPDKVSDLVYFASELTQRMHNKNSDAEVIWYDSVTCKGDLVWQNELNDKNSCFFDVCDGIFLNYTWNENNLEASVEAAQSRVQDVYVGVDVYGRNFYEGGGFNCHKALELIRKQELSTAIFAQGWTHEVLGSVDFFSNENKFWDPLQKYLLYCGPTKLPFTTSFCQGFGKNMYQKGKIISEGTWFNLSQQQLQPIWEEISRLSGNMGSITTDQAYSGGSCVTLWVDGMTVVRVMVCKIAMVPLMEFSFAYKVAGTIKYLSFTFTSEAEQQMDGGQKSVESETNLVAIQGNGEDEVSGNSVLPSEEKEENGWSIRRYLISEQSGWITSFRIKAQGPGLVYIGEVSMKQL